MAKILSIDTSTSTCSIALHDKGILISSQDIHLDKSHSEYLAISIKNLLDVSNVKINELEAIAVSKGPGSYTGLRIGTSTAKGLCYSADLKLIAINTLEGMAYGAQRFNFEKALLCPMIDARRMEVYCLIADQNNEILQPTNAVVVDEFSFEHFLQNHKVIFFGNGMAKCKEILQKYPNAVFLDDVFPSASDIGQLAWAAYNDNRFEDLAYFEPFYLKDFLAKKPSPKI